MSRPRLLDLFCGAGGAGKGYDLAGFEVIGVDIEDQPEYPFEFYRADALALVRDRLNGCWHESAKKSSLPGRLAACLGHFDAIHASPPCQASSSLTGWGQSRAVSEPKPNLIAPTREFLESTGLPYVIENVQRAKLRNAIQICGQGLGLPVRRHRRFEANFPLMGVPCRHTEPPVIVVRGSIGRKVFDPRRKAIAPTLQQAREAMGVEWMSKAGSVADAIPPAYTEHIGLYLMAEVKARRGVAA